MALPTETVYGLGADASNAIAVMKIFEAKSRPCDHPLIVHIHSQDDLKHWAEHISEDALALVNHFWPGPLTLVVQKKSHVLDEVTGSLPTVALRCPAHPVMQAILSKLSPMGLAAPSANPHKQISPTQASHVLSGLGGKIAAVVDGGACEVGVESTIVDVSATPYRILRMGPITQAMLEQVIKTPVEAPKAHQTKVAGNMVQHYQPKTKARLLSFEEILSTLTTAPGTYAVMHQSESDRLEKTTAIKMPNERHAYAQKLYSTLHQLDDKRVDGILIEKPVEPWPEVMDRLTKACA